MLYAYAFTTSVFERSGLANKKRSATDISTSFVTTLGAGVPLAYASKVKEYCESETCPEGFDKSATSGHVGLTVNPIILKDMCRLMRAPSFQVDRGVSDGLLAEMERDIRW